MAATSGPNVKADVQAAGDAGDVNKQIAFGTPGTKAIPGYPGAEAHDTGKIWTSGNFEDVFLSKLGDEIDRAHGAAYATASGTSTALVVATPKKIATPTIGASLVEFTHANNRLTYTGARTRTFLVLGNTTVGSASSPSHYRISFYVNGNPTTWQALCNIQIGFDITHTTSVVGLISLGQNDYVELWIEDIANSQSLVVSYLQLVAVEIR